MVHGKKPGRSRQVSHEAISLSAMPAVDCRYLAIHHFHNKGNTFIISFPQSLHIFWNMISTTSSKFKILAADTRKNSSFDLPHANCKDFSLEPVIYKPKSILLTSHHLIAQKYTMLADYNAQWKSCRHQLCCYGKATSVRRECS